MAPDRSIGPHWLTDERTLMKRPVLFIGRLTIPVGAWRPDEWYDDEFDRPASTGKEHHG